MVTVKLLIGSILSLVLSALAVVTYNGGSWRAERYSALDHELKLAMELMRRDISREPVPIVVDRVNGCIVFEFDRDGDGTIRDDEVGAYRHEMIGGIGVIALWMGEGKPDCGDQEPWTPVSDASVINIDAFTVSEDPGSAGPTTFTATAREQATTDRSRIRLQLVGRLVGDDDAREALEATVEVRNLVWL